MPINKISDRIKNVQSFMALDVMREANAADQSKPGSIMHLEIGQPSAPAPRQVIETAQQALLSDNLGYTEALGLDSLRAEIAAHYKRTYDLEIDKNRILITTGSSAAFTTSFLTLFDVGERVILPTPGYPAYRNILQGLGVDTVSLPSREENRFMPTAAEITELAKSDEKIKALLLTSPNNPTGTMVERTRLKEIAKACEQAGLWFVSDEIYHGLTYGTEQACALSFSDKAIIINSFSKYYCMTGWRIGWMVVPEELIEPCQRILQHFFISPPTLSQLAAVQAFSCEEELSERKEQYARNRNILMEELPKMGLGNFMPLDGAFYAYVDISHYSNNALEWAKHALQEAGVAVTPGNDFDTEHGGSFVRMSYAGSNRDIMEAMTRLKTWLKT